MRRVALLLASVLLLAPAAAGAATKKKPRPIKCNGYAGLCDKRFDKVVLPATHNSMSAAAKGFSFPNQSVGMDAQIAAGIRGFLLDTYYAHTLPDGTYVTDAKGKQPGDQLYTCHVDCKLGRTPLVTALRPLATFLKHHPDNVLLFDQEDYISTNDWAKAVKASGLLRYVYRGKPGPVWPTLRTMIRTHQQVVMLSEHKANGPSWDHLDYAGIVQETPYSFPALPLLTNPANWAKSCIPNRGGTEGSLFLFNHWSPTFAPKAATSAQVNATNTIVGRALRCRKIRKKTPTIVAVDMFRSGGLFAAVKKLNALVK